MAKEIPQYNVIWSGIRDPKTGAFTPTSFTIEASWTDPDAVKLGLKDSNPFRQQFPWDGNLTLDQLKDIVELKILADI